LIAAEPVSMRRAPEDVASPVLKVTLERAEAGSRP
jgi:hypothetical protein